MVNIGEYWFKLIMIGSIKELFFKIGPDWVNLERMDQN